jgi:hypothetical protein
VAFLYATYFDDSGTHPESAVAVVGGYQASAEQWREFSRNWDEVNEIEHFGIFRMSDFVARKQQFTQWDDTKRQRIVEKLMNIINTRTLCGFAYAVIKADFDRVVPPDLRARLGGNHYAFTVMACTGAIRDWREKYAIDVPMDYIFEKGTKGEGEVMKMLGQAAKQLGVYEALGLMPDGFSFQPKNRLVQLQAADMLAYESYRHMKIVADTGDKIPRR